MITIYHSGLNAEARVDEQSVPVWENYGWSTKKSESASEQNPAPDAAETPQVESKGKPTINPLGS